MAGEPTSRGTDQPPTEAEVGNHHWPLVTNIFESHGAKHPEHHSHPGLTIREMLRIHKRIITGGISNDHDLEQNVQYHQAMERDGCRTHSSGWKS